jgi:hypothetical protein
MQGVRPHSCLAHIHGSLHGSPRCLLITLSTTPHIDVVSNATRGGRGLGSQISTAYKRPRSTSPHRPEASRVQTKHLLASFRNFPFPSRSQWQCGDHAHYMSYYDIYVDEAAKSPGLCRSSDFRAGILHC